MMSRREFLRRAGAAAAVGVAAFSLPPAGAAAKQPKMTYRPLGKTGQKSSLLCFGGVMLGEVSQAEAEKAVHYALEHGVNHFDVAPSYGEAELRLGPALQGHREKIFLACKTEKRTRKEAEAEFHASLKRLRTDHVDLYQFHALDSREDLDTVTGAEGAWAFFQEAKRQGWVRFVGITGHRPATHLEALRRMPLDTVMFPVNFIEWERSQPAAQQLLEYATQHQLGVIGIKSISAGPWLEKKHAYATWYRPFDTIEQIMPAFRFTLSQPITTAAAAGEIKLLKPLIEAAERFTPLSAKEQATLLATAKQYQPLFANT